MCQYIYVYSVNDVVFVRCSEAAQKKTVEQNIERNYPNTKSYIFEVYSASHAIDEVRRRIQPLLNQNISCSRFNKKVIRIITENEAMREMTVVRICKQVSLLSEHVPHRNEILNNKNKNVEEEEKYDEEPVKRKRLYKINDEDENTKKRIKDEESDDGSEDSDDFCMSEDDESDESGEVFTKKRFVNDKCELFMPSSQSEHTEEEIQDFKNQGYEVAEKRQIEDSDLFQVVWKDSWIDLDHLDHLTEEQILALPTVY